MSFCYDVCITKCYLNTKLHKLLNRLTILFAELKYLVK